MKVSPELLSRLPDRNKVVTLLEHDPELLVNEAELPGRRLAPATGAAAESLESLELAFAPVVAPLPQFFGEIQRTGEQLLRAGAEGLRRLEQEGDDTELTPEQQLGLEAIVLVEGRPAILILAGAFLPPPSEWRAQLEAQRAQIEQTFRSVGRIELSGHPSLDWVGTGFVVGPNAVMTNRHVALEFLRQQPRRRWAFQAGMHARIDYAEELGTTEPAEFVITDVFGIHETYDLALLRVEASGGGTLPAPLVVASKQPAPLRERQVYVVGYPARDDRRNDRDVMQQIFANIFNVKRLQPGQITHHRPSKGLLEHDCSTMGGNSGSCVVDLETHQVLGLHFGGRYMQTNYAVALHQLVDDPLLKLRRARINFA